MQNNFNEYRNTYIDTNECTSRGACSVAPNIASLQELIIYFLKQLSYYVIKLEKLGANNNSIKFEIINDLASMVAINEFSENQLYEILEKDYLLYTDAKNAYHEICTQKGISHKDLIDEIKFKNTSTISKAISQGEKLFLDKYNKLSLIQKNLMAILRITLISTSINLLKLQEFKEFDENIYQIILHILDMFNHGKVTNKEIKKEITKLANLDNELQLEISKQLLEKFGEISKVEVSHSTRKGKAILVSGNNFIDLLNILESTKDKDIDVYTHSNLLITHSLKGFMNYPHLQGHYGDASENCILDFATFPGAILLTKNSQNNTEYLYRGRLFSSDYFVHNGVVKVENNDFSELITSAKNAKGFSKGKIKPTTTIGYDENDLNEKIKDITNKLKSKEIERLFIIGMNPYSEVQKSYFKRFFARLKPNEFAISFSYECNKENVLTINVGNYSPLATNIIKKVFENYPIDSDNVIFYFSKCDVMTISNVIMLKSQNAKNIYIATCHPTLINPSVFKTLQEEYDLNITTNPQKDLNKIRK